MKILRLSILICLVSNSLFSQNIDEISPIPQLQYIENSLGKFAPFIGSNASVTGNGKNIYFIGYDSLSKRSFYYHSSYLRENYWSKPIRLDYLHGRDKDGNTFCSLTPLFQTYDDAHIYYERNYGVAVQRKPDIWFFTNDTKTFSKAPMINTLSGETSASISPDGKKLFFIRTIFYKHGGGIYVSNKQDNGEWGKPERLPDYINNSYIGEARICADGKTLLFSAERKEGRGFRDIYSTKLDSEGNWSKPENLSFVNSPLIECSPSMPLKGDKIYFNRQEKGLSYVYVVRMPLKYRYKKFVVVDSLIVDNITNQTIALSTINFTSKTSKINIEGEKLLNSIAELLNESQSLVLIISAHTDNVGNDKNNLKLSLQRAETVANYLVSKGLNKSRFIVKGYGETMPKVPNDTPQNRALNRRVEFRVLINNNIK
jgi:outer membrane protein OmpA-like peptidoglycan-associated protein